MKANQKQLKNKRKELTLKHKVELIKYLDEGNSERKAFAEFQCKGAVNNIKKTKKEYLNQFEKSNANIKDIYRKLRKTDNEEINQLTWNWYSKVRSNKIPISGTLIKEAALEIAKKLGKLDFCTSNLWLESFCKRHNLSFKIISGEIASADMEGAEEFMKKFPLNRQGYKQKNIFNADETSLFFKELPSKTLIEKYIQVGVRGQIFNRKTYYSFSNQLVRRKVKTTSDREVKVSQCFKSIIKSNLPARYQSTKKAWMNVEIFNQWLQEQNNFFQSQDRKIILFLDNCSVHRDQYLSNIKLIFLPPNTTSIIQPLYQGIIRCFKSYYRKLVLQRYITITNNSNQKLNFNELTILDSLYFIDTASKQIQLSNICDTQLLNEFFYLVSLCIKQK